MSELPLTNSVKPNSQFIMLLPVNLVDFIRASFSHLQDPGAWVGLQLKVPLQTQEDIRVSDTVLKEKRTK